MHGKLPPRRKPDELSGCPEALSQPVFQAGISCRVIGAGWPGIRAAFAGFDPVAVAEYGPEDVARLLADRQVVRSKATIEAAAGSAPALIELDAEQGGFDRYLRSRGRFRDTVAGRKRQFRFIGGSGAYQFPWQAGEPMPGYHTWQATR
jgi:3-methyladenine DNA glycosylase Tag